MNDSMTGSIKDKFLAGATVAVLLVCYMLLTLKGVDTKFIEGAFLLALGAFIGLLKQSTSPQTTVQQSDVTNVRTEEAK
jgi:hypothetical protein